MQLMAEEEEYCKNNNTNNINNRMTGAACFFRII